MKFLRLNLDEHRRDKNDAEDRGADQIAGALGFVGGFAEPRHGHGVASGFTESGGEDFDDPEAERNQRDFGDEVSGLFGHYSTGTQACSCHHSTRASLLPRKILRSARAMLATRIG